MREEISLGSVTGVVHVTLDDGSEEYRFQDSHALIAIVMSQAKPSMGLSFPTSEAEEFQIGQMSWPTGHKIQAHSHKPITRTTQSTSEVLFIRRGRVRMTLFTAEGQPLATKDLGEGDVVALFSGGHGFEILEDADIVEVKQGPYTGEDEKFRFPDTDEA